MPDYLVPIPEYDPWNKIPSCTNKPQTRNCGYETFESDATRQEKSAEKERKDRRKAYNKAIQEQIEEESLQEGKIGQKCFGPKRSLEYKEAEFRKTRNEIRGFPTADFCSDN